MSQEIMNVATRLGREGYGPAANILRSLTIALLDNGLIPRKLGEHQFTESLLLPFEFVITDEQRDSPFFRGTREIDVLGLPSTTRNILAKEGGHATNIRWLHDASDETLLLIRRMGPARLAELRERLSSFAEWVAIERGLKGLPPDDETPLGIPFPVKK